jgi:hypothetical protein
MSRQLPQSNIPLLPDNEQPSRKPRITLPVIFIAVMGLLACSIFALVATLLFKDSTPAMIIAPTSGQIAIDSTLTSTPQTQVENIAIASQTPYPTYTPLPTYTLGIIPIIPTSTSTVEPNLIFEDNFDNGIDATHWQTFGTWAVANGAPVAVERYASDNKFNYGAFSSRSGLIFPGTAQLDNIAVEFDVDLYLHFILAFKDEYNYKSFYISQAQLDFFRFISNGNIIGIPQSHTEFTSNKPTHVRVEIKGNSLTVYINQKIEYDFQNLPEPVSGAIGFSVGHNQPAFDNFKIYQLP